MSSVVEVKGKLVNDQTGCAHYHSPADIIAIKFKCCNAYYACYYCHQELAGHEGLRWDRSEFQQKAILCGSCKTELTISEYFESGYQCPYCLALFNPKCSNHNQFYFEMGNE